jgi:hypothetical protein
MDADDLEPVVEDDEIRAPAGLDYAEIGPAQDACRNRRRRSDRLFEWNPERVQVPHRVDHRQDGSGEHTVLAERDAVGHLDLDVAELVDASVAGRTRWIVGDDVDLGGTGASSVIDRDGGKMYGVGWMKLPG